MAKECLDLEKGDFSTFYKEFISENKLQLALDKEDLISS